MDEVTIRGRRALPLLCAGLLCALTLTSRSTAAPPPPTLAIRSLRACNRNVAPHTARARCRKCVQAGGTFITGGSGRCVPAAKELLEEALTTVEQCKRQISDLGKRRRCHACVRDRGRFFRADSRCEARSFRSAAGVGVGVEATTPAGARSAETSAPYPQPWIDEARRKHRLSCHRLVYKRGCALLRKGVVTVAVTLRENGRVAKVKLVKSTIVVDSALVVRCVLRELASWRFAPPRGVASHFELAFAFSDKC